MGPAWPGACSGSQILVEMMTIVPLSTGLRVEDE